MSQINMVWSFGSGIQEEKVKNKIKRVGRVLNGKDKTNLVKAVGNNAADTD